MRKVLFAALLLCSANFIQAQSCSYAGGTCTGGLVDPTDLAVRVVSDVCRVLNRPYINIYRGQVPNACATVYNGTPIISYNQDFLNYLASNNSWAPVSVIAHEIGHHVNMHSSWYGSFQHPWTRELQADFVSGYVLFKLGASWQDATSAFNIMFSWMGTESHPDTPRRIEALTQGYNRAAMGL